MRMDVSNLLNYVLENLDSLAIIEESGTVVYWNSAAERMFGLSKDEVVGKYLWDTVVSKADFVRLFSGSKNIEIEVANKNVEVTVSSFAIAGQRYLALTFRDVPKDFVITKDLYETVINNILDIVFIVDSNGVIKFVSPSVRNYGYSEKEVVGKYFLDFVHPEDRRKFVEVFKQRFEGEEDFHEYRLLAKNGEVRYCQSTSRLVRFEDGTVGLVGVIRDITERKKLEENLIESQEKFRKFAEKALVGIYMIQDFKFTYVNPMFSEIVGRSTEELLNLDPMVIIHPDDRELVRRNIKLRLNGIVDSIRYKFRIVRKDGEVRYVESRGTAIRYRGKLVIIGTLVDITEETKLKEKLEEYKRFYENAEDMFFILDSMGEFVDVNPRFAKMLGYTKEEVIRKNARDFVKKEDFELVKEKFKSVLRGERVRYKSRVVAKNGKEYVMEITMWPVFKDGKIAGAEGIIRDVTDREKLEKKLRESEELFRTLAEKAPTGIYLAKSGRFIYVNPMVEKIAGYSRKELLKMNPFELVHPDYVEIVKSRYLKREMGESVPERYEFKIITKNGEEKWIDVQAARVTVDEEPAVLGNFIDITERKKVEEKQRRINNLLIASSRIFRRIIKGANREKLLKHVCRKITKYGEFKACVVAFEKDGRMEFITAGSGVVRRVVKSCRIIKTLASKMDKYIVNCGSKECRRCLRRKSTNIVISFPLVCGKVYGTLIIFSDRVVDEEEKRILSDTAKVVGIALNQIELAEEKEIALKQIRRNLEQFEMLADRLRNPLAVIKGYLEIRDLVDKENIFIEIEKQVRKIEGTLEELASEEVRTHVIDKLMSQF